MNEHLDNLVSPIDLIEWLNETQREMMKPGVWHGGPASPPEVTKTLLKARLHRRIIQLLSLLPGAAPEQEIRLSKAVDSAREHLDRVNNISDELRQGIQDVLVMWDEEEDEE